MTSDHKAHTNSPEVTKAENQHLIYLVHSECVCSEEIQICESYSSYHKLNPLLIHNETPVIQIGSYSIQVSIFGYLGRELH